MARSRWVQRTNDNRDGYFVLPFSGYEPSHHGDDRVAKQRIEGAVADTQRLAGQDFYLGESGTFQLAQEIPFGQCASDAASPGGGLSGCLRGQVVLPDGEIGYT